MTEVEELKMKLRNEQFGGCIICGDDFDEQNECVEKLTKVSIEYTIGVLEDLKKDIIGVNITTVNNKISELKQLLK